MAQNQGGKRVWLDGRIVDYESAKVPILTHSMQYGSGIFEGIRSYEVKGGALIFRLRDHVERFFNTAKIYSMKLGYTPSELEKAIGDVVRENGASTFYIRPFAFYNDDRIGVGVSGKRVSVFIAAVPFGEYFNKAKGITCKVSSWHRINSSILPIEAKASGNYINSIIAGNEAKVSGFDEAIMLSNDGYVAEGSAENIFVVKDKKLITPSESADILIGITRDTIIKIATTLGYTVEERQVHREELYTADEVFFTGTAAEVTPIINIDGIRIGDGAIGPVSRRISDKYSDLVHGKDKKYSSWLTLIKK